MGRGGNAAVRQGSKEVKYTIEVVESVLLCKGRLALSTRAAFRSPLVYSLYHARRSQRGPCFRLIFARIQGPGRRRDDGRSF